MRVSLRCSHSIMHGDIKPDNIFFTMEKYGNLYVKLCDLECARPVGKPFPHNGQSLRYTELYASPDVLHGKAGELKASLEMDLFSLGLVLWQLANKQSKMPSFMVDMREKSRLLESPATDVVMDAMHATSGDHFLADDVLDLCNVDPALQSALVPRGPCPAKRPSATWTLVKSVATLAESTAQANEEQAVIIRGLIASMEGLKVCPEMLESVQGKLTLLLRDTHSIPTLVVVLPKVHHSFVSKKNPMRILKKEAVMFFVCSETWQVVPCGKDGNGIPLSDFKDAVKKAASVLTVGLICLKLGLLAGGVPLPLPIGGISKLLSGDGELCQQYLDSAVGLLGNTLDSAWDNDVVLSSELLVDGL